MTPTAPAILGIDVDVFETDLSIALDKFDPEFQEHEPDTGATGGFYMDSEYSLTVNLAGADAIPTSHTFWYRRAISGDDAIEVQYHAKLAKYTVETETAIYNLKEVQ